MGVSEFGTAVVKPRIGAGGAGVLVVSELEVTESGLYLDVLPGNAEAFTDLVA